jgi:hypothetical protein
MPDLKPICVCQSVANLDDDLSECSISNSENSKCAAMFHPECYRQSGMPPNCTDCKEEIPRSQIYPHVRAMQPDQDKNPDQAKSINEQVYKR